MVVGRSMSGAEVHRPRPQLGNGELQDHGTEPTGHTRGPGCLTRRGPQHCSTSSSATTLRPLDPLDRLRFRGAGLRPGPRRGERRLALGGVWPGAGGAAGQGRRPDGPHPLGRADRHGGGLSRIGRNNPNKEEPSGGSIVLRYSTRRITLLRRHRSALMRVPLKGCTKT